MYIPVHNVIFYLCNLNTANQLEQLFHASILEMELKQTENAFETAKGAENAEYKTPFLNPTQNELQNTGPPQATARNRVRALRIALAHSNHYHCDFYHMIILKKCTNGSSRCCLLSAALAVGGLIGTLLLVLFLLWLSSRVQLTTTTNLPHFTTTGIF